MDKEINAYLASFKNWGQQFDPLVGGQEWQEACMQKFEKDIDEEVLSHEKLVAFWVNFFVQGYHKYGDEEPYKQLLLYERLKSVAHTAFFYLMESNHDGVLNDVQKWLLSRKIPLHCDDFVFYLASPLKDGFPGMWTKIGKMIEKIDAQPGLVEMCHAMEVICYSKDNNEIIDALTKVLMANSEVHLANQLLGYTYYNAKMWKNAIAQFEQFLDVEDRFSLFYRDQIYFWLAWAYGKTKNYIDEERCFRKSLEILPNGEHALNNLGYCLYKQKRYDEAQEIFQRCIDEGRDGAYPVKNLERTLLAKKKLAQATGEDLFGDEPIFEDEEAREEPQTTRPSTNNNQFSSEKLLEDELILRLERGSDVFGIPLRVYERKGAYGRQFIIPAGRLDILAVDDDENLYVIEVKKDSGYDDAYAQTLRYIEWLEENMVKDGQTVQGIICLNNPDPGLVDKVRANAKVRLFEYKIFYEEVI